MKKKSCLAVLLSMAVACSANVMMAEGIARPIAELPSNTSNANNLNPKPLMSKLPKKGKIVKESYNEALGAKDLELSNGVRVLFKHTDYEPDMIWMNATQRGGSSLYGEKDWANCETFNAVIRASGLGGLSNMELKQALDGRINEYGFRMDTYNDKFWGSSTIKNMETLFQLAYLQFTNVTKDEKSYNTQINDMKKELEKQEQSPDLLFFGESVFMDSIMSVMHDHNWRYKTFKSTDMAGLNYDRILEIAKERTANAAGYTFVFVGSFDEAAIRPLIEQYIASLPANKAVKPNWVNVATYPQQETICHFTHKMQDPRAEINIRWISTQIPYSFENGFKASVLSDILKFKKYRKRIRVDNAGVYHEVGGNHQHYMQGDIPFTEVHTFVTLKPGFADEAVRIMKEEMAKACEHIDEADFETFKQEKLKFLANRKSHDHDNFYWMRAIEEYASTGEVDLDNDNDYVQIIQAITPEDISAFARELLTTGNMVEIVMTPAE